MGKFEAGDRIVNANGDTATVVGVTDTISVDWGDGLYGTWDAANFEKVARTFRPGQFVRIDLAVPEFGGEVGIVFDDDGDPEDMDPYSVALYDAAQTEEFFSANELWPWLPLVGSRVIESGVEEDETGTVIGVSLPDCDGAIVARVLWDSFPHAQDWLVSDLEPADEYENGFSTGDAVEYSNPFFAGTAKATVVGVDGNLLGVEFEPGCIFADGNYSADFFKIAA